MFRFRYNGNKFMEIWQTVSKDKQSTKHFELLFRNRSIQDGLSTFFIFVSSGSILSSINSIFSYFLLYVSNSVPIPYKSRFKQYTLSAGKKAAKNDKFFCQWRIFFPTIFLPMIDFYRRIFLPTLFLQTRTFSIF